jgi:hypothetical protein
MLKEKDLFKNTDEIFFNVLREIKSNKKSKPDKWDIIAALFIAAAFAAITLGLAWGINYILVTLSSGKLASLAISFAIGDSKDVAKNLKTLIVKCMPWLIKIKPWSSVKKLHSQTKDFLIEHFGTPDKLQKYLN